MPIAISPHLAHPTWHAYLIEYAISLAALLLIGRNGDPNALIIFASPPFWLGLFLVGLGLLRVRQRESAGPSDAKIYRVPWYPWTVLAFLVTCAWLAWTSTLYARDHLNNEAWGVMGIFALGIALSFGLTSRADEA